MKSETRCKKGTVKNRKTKKCEPKKITQGFHSSCKNINPFTKQCRDSVHKKEFQQMYDEKKKPSKEVMKYIRAIFKDVPLSSDFYKNINKIYLTKSFVDFITLEDEYSEKVYNFQNYEAYVYDLYYGNMKLVTDHLMKDVIMKLASSEMVDDDDLQTYCLDVGKMYYDNPHWKYHWSVGKWHT